VSGRGWTAAAWIALSVVPLAILGPFAIVASGDRYNARRVLEMVWAGLAVATLLAPSIRTRARQRWRALSGPTRGAVAGFVAWAALSAVLSAAPGHSLREWALGTLVATALLPLAALWRGREKEIRLTLAVTVLLYGVLALARPEVHGFAHPRFQGQVLAVAGPVLLFAGDAALALFAAPALAAGILSGSRALVAALVGVAAVALAAWPERRRRMGPALLALAVVAALVAGSGLVAGGGGEVGAAVARGVSDNGRLQIWSEVLALVRERPLTGVGPGLTARYPGLGNWAAHPHSVTVTVLGEMGIVGLVLGLVLVVQFARTGLDAPPRLHPWVLAMVAGLGHGQLSGTFVMPAAQIMLAVVAAVLLAETGPRPDAAPPPGETGGGWIIVAVGLVAAATLAATVDLPTVRPASTSTWSPRFWLPGAIPTP
jgi:O-antigen ligase